MPDSCQRPGAAAVEFAIVSPMVLIFIATLIQVGSLMMIQNVMTSAVRDAARYASLPQADSFDKVNAKVTELLEQGGLDTDSIKIQTQPEDLSTVTAGQMVNVSVRGSINDLVWLGALLPFEIELSAGSTSTRE